MRSNTKPVIIWTDDGCWYQQTVNGAMRSSYLGHIGPPAEVREWCENNAIDFATKFHAFEGTGMAEKWPTDCAPNSAHAVGRSSCPAAPVGPGRKPLA